MVPAERTRLRAPHLRGVHAGAKRRQRRQITGELRMTSEPTSQPDPARPAPMALLLEALHDESARIRRFAADVLGEMGDPRAVDPLIAKLNDADHLVRQNAMASL